MVINLSFSLDVRLITNFELGAVNRLMLANRIIMNLTFPLRAVSVSKLESTELVSLIHGVVLSVLQLVVMYWFLLLA